MATQSLSTNMFDNAWVWDCGCSQHVTSDRSVFVSFRKLSGQKPVKGLAGSLILIGVGNVRLSCKSINGPQIVEFQNVLYILEATVSLISQGQIHRQGHRLRITSDGIALGNSGIVIKLSSNNLYLIHLTERASSLAKTDLALTAINGETGKMWHERLGHLGEQNIRRLATMSEGIDLSKPPPSDACVPCTISSLQTEPHKLFIEPGKHFLELVHSNLIGPLDTAYSGARYAVTFLEDFHKGSMIYFLTQKSDVFKTAKQYYLQFKQGDSRIRRLRTDWGGEYDSIKWKEFCEEKGIHWELGVPGNPEMNGASERLGQTLHKKACTMMKDSGLSMVYWPELMSTANYLCNRQPVTRRDVTLYKANVGQKPQLSHLRRVGQYGYAQV